MDSRFPLPGYGIRLPHCHSVFNRVWSGAVASLGHRYSLISCEKEQGLQTSKRDWGKRVCVSGDERFCRCYRTKPSVLLSHPENIVPYFSSAFISRVSSLRPSIRSGYVSHGTWRFFCSLASLIYQETFLWGKKNKKPNKQKTSGWLC